MLDMLVTVLGSANFEPHGHCFLWQRPLLWLYVLSDSLIALSYYLIPLALIQFVRKRKDLAFNWMFVMFGVFIFACGTTHLMGVWTIWQPVYWLDGGIKALTAGVSFITAVMLWPLIPKAVALPSPAALQAINRELQTQMVERDLAVENQRQSEERFRLLVEGVKDYAIFLLDPRGFVSTWNAGAEHIKGYRTEEIVGQHFSCFYPPEDVQNNKPDRILKAAETEGQYEEEGLRVRKDGSLFSAHAIITALRDSKGDLYGFTKVVRDITLRRMAEEKFRSVLETAPFAMVIVNKDGNITMVNSQVEKLFGYERHELFGKAVEHLVPERYRQSHLNYRFGFFNKPSLRPMETGLDLYGQRKDGSEFPVEITLGPLETEEGLMVSAAIRDVTDRKKNEEQIRMALKEKEVLLREIHHRVKNNMQVISSLLRLQIQHVKDAGTIEFFTECQNRIKAMALIHELFYRSPNLTNLDFKDYVEDLVLGLYRSYGVDPDRIARKVDVDGTSIEIAAAIPCGLIINELVSNSLKYAFPGNRKGEIVITFRALSEDQIELVVGDNGVGLPGHLDIINTESLGLQLVRLLVERQLYGEIQTEKENGTRFRITFSRVK